MSEQVKWLQGEVRIWEREGLVSHEQAQAIMNRYPAAVTGGIPWGIIIFSCLGAVIFGLGCILLLAYNWDAISKYAKLAIVIGSLATVHLIGIRIFLSTGRYRPLGEGICLLGTMLFGAGIWLVAQIYHIDEHFPNAFLIWGLGALGMALVMPSIPQAILAVVLLTIWSGCERVGFDTPLWITPILLLVVVGPLAWRRRSRMLLGVLIPAFFIAYGFSLPVGNDSIWLIFSALLSLGALCLAVAYLTRQVGAFPGAAPVFSSFGSIVFAVMLYLLTFPNMADAFFSWHTNRMNWAYVLLPLIGVLISWGAVARLKITGVLKHHEGTVGPEIALIPLTVILATVDLMIVPGLTGWMIAGPFNLVFICLAASLMARGCREGLIKPTVWGSVLLVLLLVARYFDLFESLLVRGLVFVVMGTILLAEGFLYARAKKQKTKGGAQ
ncbi:MAG: DUF2157 domain-containing protein [Kiritimatiellia bacterium]